MATNSYASYKKKNEPKKGQTSIFLWLMLISTSIFLFVFPYFKALFNGMSPQFDKPIYSSFLWASLTLIVVTLYMFLNWKMEKRSDYLIPFSFLIPVSFWISSLSGASYLNSHNGIYISMVYICLFLIGVLSCRTTLGKQYLLTNIMLSGYVMVIFGFMNLFGNAHYQDAVMMEGTTGRLTSVFQYPNTYAALLIGIYMACLFLTVNLKNKWLMSLNALMLFPTLLAFLSTYSRGAFLAFPIVIVLLLFILPFYKQISILLQIVISGIASLALLSKFSAWGNALRQHPDASTSFKAWAVLIGVAVFVAAIHYIIQRFLIPRLENLSAKPNLNKIIPILVIVVGVIGAGLVVTKSPVLKLLPKNLGERILSISLSDTSASSRTVFVKDSVKIFKDYPLFGTGAGGWAALYEKYQDNPYISRQAHSAFFQFLNEIGAVGLLIMIALIGFICFRFFRSIRGSNDTPNTIVFFILAISILLHSLIDFDLSFVYMTALLFLSFGAVQGSTVQESDSIIHESIAKWSKVVPGIVGLSAIFLFFISVQSLQAASAYDASVDALHAGKQSYNEVMQPLDTAISKSPNNYNYYSQKISLDLSVLNQNKNDQLLNEVGQLIEKARQLEPYEPKIVRYEADYLNRKNQYDQALKVLDETRHAFRWNIDWYNMAISIGFNADEQARMNKNAADQNKYWNHSLQTYKELQQNMEELKKQKLGSEQKPFGVTPMISAGVGQIYFMRGDYANASAVLKYNVNDNFKDPTIKAIDRYYLASLIKQNQNDQALYDKFVASDPNEKTQIQALVDAKFE